MMAVRAKARKVVEHFLEFACGPFRADQHDTAPGISCRYDNTRSYCTLAKAIDVTNCGQ
jgi:hypothetical protein